LCDRLERELSRAEAHSLAKALGHPAPQRLFGVVMKEPEKNECNRQIKAEETWNGVAERRMRATRETILEIGYEAAGNNGGGNEPGAAKGYRCGCMGECKRHFSYYDVPRRARE
jgi:hypothetical protein